MLLKTKLWVFLKPRIKVNQNVSKNFHGVGKKIKKQKIWKQSEFKISKNIRNLFGLNKENEAMRNKIIKNINILFEQEKDYYKPLRVFHIEYESNGDRNKTRSIKEYLDVIKPYLKDIINNLRKSNTCKIQLTIEVKFISPKEIDA